MVRKNTNKPLESFVPTKLLLKGTVSAPILNGQTQRQSDVVGTLSVLDFQGRVVLVTCNHVIRKWADKGPLISPILEIEVTKGKGAQKWVTANLKRFRWAGLNIDMNDTNPDGYFDLRVAVLPKDETDQINKDLLLPVHYISDINDSYFAVLTGYPEAKNTKDEMRKRKPHPWAKPWWFEQFSKIPPSGDKRLIFDWTHKNGNFIYEQQASADSAIFVSTGSAPLPYGISGGPLIFLGSQSETNVPLLSVIGYGMEYDEEGKKIIAGPSDAIIGLATNLIKMEADGESLVLDKD